MVKLLSVVPWVQYPGFRPSARRKDSSGSPAQSFRSRSLPTGCCPDERLPQGVVLVDEVPAVLRPGMP